MDDVNEPIHFDDPDLPDELGDGPEDPVPFDPGDGDLDPAVDHPFDDLVDADPLDPHDVDDVRDPLSPDDDWSAEDRERLAAFLERAEAMGATQEQLDALEQGLDPEELEGAIESLDWDPVGRSTGLAMWVGGLSSQFEFGGEDLVDLEDQDGEVDRDGELDRDGEVDLDDQVDRDGEVDLDDQVDENDDVDPLAHVDLPGIGSDPHPTDAPPGDLTDDSTGEPKGPLLEGIVLNVDEGPEGVEALPVRPGDEVDTGAVKPLPSILGPDIGTGVQPMADGDEPLPGGVLAGAVTADPDSVPGVIGLPVDAIETPDGADPAPAEPDPGAPGITLPVEPEDPQGLEGSTALGAGATVAVAGGVIDAAASLAGGAAGTIAGGAAGGAAVAAIRAASDRAKARRDGSDSDGRER